MKTCLIAVQGPLQMVTAIIALEWLEKTSESELILLMYDFSAPDAVEAAMAEIIKKIAKMKNWANEVFISKNEMKVISFNQYAKCKKLLQEKLGYQHIDTILIARDFGSFGTQLILNTYYNAKHIEYGDSFGLVSTGDDLKLSWSEIRKSPLIFLKSTLKKIIYNHYPRRIKFDAAILSIPIDWSGDYLKDRDIIIPSKEHVTSVVAKIANGLSDLKDYSNSVMHHVNDCTLVLLSNFKNSGFSTFDDEVNLYEEIINKNVPQGDTIILKNHPRGDPDVYKELVKRIEGKYNVKIVSDKYNLYPVELWTDFIKHCSIIPVFSSSSISINYIYSKEILLTLEDETIEKYIYKHKQAETQKGERMNKVALNNLKNWDQKSLIWSDYNKN